MGTKMSGPINIKEPYMLKQGTIILEPLHPWYQGAGTKVDGDKKIIEMPNTIVGRYVVGRLHGNSILRSHKEGVLSIIEEIKGDDIKKIYAFDPFAVAIMMAAAPLLSLEFNEKAKKIAFENDFLTLYGVGIASYLPQRNLAFTDAIPAYDYGIPRYVVKYNRAREILKSEVGIELLPPKVPPSEYVITLKYSRRQHLKDEYNKRGLDYKQPDYILKSGDEMSGKDPFRGMIVQREIVTDLQPLISYVTTSKSSVISGVQVGMLVAGFTRMKTIGPKSNLFNVYFVGEVVDTTNGNEYVVVSGLDREANVEIMNDNAKMFYNKFTEWIKNFDFAGSIIELAKTLMDQADKEGKMKRNKKEEK